VASSLTPGASAPPGIDADAVPRWLDDQPTLGHGPWDISLIAAGGSNLTYRVVDGAGVASALRRPPVGRTLASAHDTDREWRIMSALGAHGIVPVPTCLARCDDADVTGAPFIVMSFVDGTILRTSADTAGLGHRSIERATAALLDTQVALHTLDLHDVGLTDLGRHDGYVSRQIRRWTTQVTRHHVRPVDDFVAVGAALESVVPPERAAPALAHGDYRFDNVVLHADHTMAAVLDWELCTTGDPIADFAWSLQYWARPDDETPAWLPDAPTRTAGFCERDELVERYGRATGFDLRDLPFYTAFSWWKQACISEGVHARRAAGVTAGASDDGALSDIAARADAMLAHARTLLEALDR